MKAKVWKILIGTVVLVVLCSVVPVPVPVEKELTEVEVGTKTRQVTGDKVTIKGVYYCYLFRENVFQGKLQIESRDASGSRRLLKLSLSGSPYVKGKTGLLNYYDGYGHLPMNALKSNIQG